MNSGLSDFRSIPSTQKSQNQKLDNAAGWILFFSFLWGIHIIANQRLKKAGHILANKRPRKSRPQMSANQKSRKNGPKI